MTIDEVKAQLLWMLANRPGYYMWVGWLRSLPVEHQEWVLAQWPLVRQTMNSHIFNIRMWELSDAFDRTAKTIFDNLKPAMEMVAKAMEAFWWSMPSVSIVYRTSTADGLQTRSPKFRVVEREG